ncbi:MAG: hypothetical protein AAF368_12740 [Planctomycetota bacterium]
MQSRHSSGGLWREGAAWTLIVLSSLGLLFSTVWLRLGVLLPLVGGLGLLVALLTRRLCTGRPSTPSAHLGTVLGYLCISAVLFFLCIGRVETETVRAHYFLQPSGNGKGVGTARFEFSGFAGFYWTVVSPEIEERYDGATASVDLVVERVLDFGCTRSLRVVQCGDLESWTAHRSSFGRVGASARTYGSEEPCWCR